MAETWLISDPHFGHHIAAAERGFGTTEDHDRWLVDQCRRRFHPTDTIWWLGDIAFDGWQARLADTIDYLPGHHHLILGNHDRAHPCNRNASAHLDRYRARFETVQLAASIRWEGRELLLSHFPYDGDHTDDERYQQWRLRDFGATLIHGHTHAPEKFSRSRKGTVQIHVGVDAWRRPVRLGELIRSAEAWVLDHLEDR